MPDMSYWEALRHFLPGAIGLFFSVIVLGLSSTYLALTTVNEITGGKLIRQLPRVE